MTTLSNRVRHLARASVAVALLGGAGLGLSACNTYHGAKEDLSNAGTATGNAADTAGTAVGGAAHTAAKATGNAFDSAGHAISNTANSVTQ
jgi:predicted small secreted protein